MNLSEIVSFVLLRTQSVDNVLRVFDRTQRKLVALSERLRAIAVKEELAAAKKLAKAKANSAEAERATSVANKIADLVR